jgi:hypothetical protein
LEVIHVYNYQKIKVKNMEQMSLDKSCIEKYSGRRVYVKTQAGWGWTRLERDAPRLSYKESAGPPSFYNRIERFFYYKGQLRGAIAKVEQPEHLYNGFWTVFYTRHLGLHDFVANLCSYIILIGPDEPRRGNIFDDPVWSINWPIWHFSQSPQLLGYAMIAESKEMLSSYERRISGLSTC